MNPAPLTPEQVADEWAITYETRLGNLAGSSEPTDEQRDLAAEEADAHIADLKKQKAESTLRI